MDRKDFFHKNRLLILLGILIVVLLLFYYNSSPNATIQLEKDSSIVTQEGKTTQEVEKKIIVHISGEVKNSGIVELKEGQRLYEALELIGGTTINADVDKVNLAMILEDQQKIVIPTKQQVATTTSQQQQDEKINLNTAEKSDLMTLPGIGETIAESIIQYREENNGFKKPEEIKNVARIGDVTYERIKEKIVCY